MCITIYVSKYFCRLRFLTGTLRPAPVSCVAPGGVLVLPHSEEFPQYKQFRAEDGQDYEIPYDRDFK